MRTLVLAGCASALLALLLVGAGVAQKKLNKVPPGSWGGAGVRFTIGENSVTIEYDCAAGEIPKPLMVDRKGSFVALGVHRRLSPGPVRLNIQPMPIPARYEGKLTGKSLRYRVVLIASGEMVGEFSAERGKEARVRGCR